MRKPNRPLVRIRFIQRLQFWLERQFIRGASFQLLAVAAFIGLISLLGGVLVMPLTGDAEHFGEAVWWAFLRLTDPGYLGDDQGVWRRMVSTWLTVSGYVVFLGALVAIMTQWLNARMRQLESGLTPVATRNHVVILGWSNRTLPVVGEILQSSGRVQRFLANRHASRLRLVILCDQVTPWHAQALRDEPAIGKRGRQIVLRTGTPLVMDDLERVDCRNAAAVIVPSGGAATTLSADMATLKALLSLANQPGTGAAPLPYVVAEIQDPRKVTVARRAYPGPLEIISGNSLISRLLAQNLRHRGLSRVYGELLSHRVGCGIYVREQPDFAGRAFADLQGHFSRAIVCGVVRWEEGRFVPYLNPPAAFELRAEDRLVYVARDYDDTAVRGAIAQASAAGQARTEPPAGLAAAQLHRQPQRVLILGWNSKVATLAHELDTYTGEAFDLTLVSMVSERARQNILEEQGTLIRVKCRHIEADYALEHELRRLEPYRFDNVLLASSERMATGEEVDTRAVVAYLLLEELLEGQSASPQLILELQDPGNETLLGRRQAEVMISPLILARMVAQVALRRELRAVFDELFTAGGPELVYQSADSYGLAGITRRFGELQTAVRARGATLLGIYHTSRDALELNPAGSDTMTLTADDQLVVMATYG